MARKGWTGRVRAKRAAAIRDRREAHEWARGAVYSLGRFIPGNRWWETPPKLWVGIDVTAPVGMRNFATTYQG